MPGLRSDILYRAGILIIVIAAAGLLVGLGIWQLSRSAEKQALDDRYAARAQQAPAVLNGSVLDYQALRYRRTRLAGRFVQGDDFLLDNRVHRGVAGYHVLSPLLLANGKDAVLINRGWLALGSSREHLPVIATLTEELQLQGLITLPPAEVLLLGPGGYEASAWPRVIQYVDFNRMEQATGLNLLPVVVLLNPDSPSGFVRAWQPVGSSLGAARHRAYAIQWFGLALIFVFVCFLVARRTA